MNQTIEYTITYRFTREEIIAILFSHITVSTEHTPKECVSLGTNEEEIYDDVYVVFRELTQKDIE